MKEKGVTNQKTIIIGEKQPCDRVNIYCKRNKKTEIIAAKSLSDGALRLWYYLSGNREDYSFQLSYKYLADNFGFSSRCKYRNAVNELIEKKFLVQQDPDINSWTFIELPDDMETTGLNKILQEEESTAGFVYIIRMNGQYKIGKANERLSRFAEYTRYPEKPKIISLIYVTDNSYTQAKLHDMFKEQRLRGGTCEWFTLNDEQLGSAKDYLKSMEISMSEELQEHFNNWLVNYNSAI